MLVPWEGFFCVHAEAEKTLSSDSDEECLRPSLLRKRRQLQTSAPQCENTPANWQTWTPSKKASGIHATAYSPPASQTPFVALFPRCASNDAAFSPTAEHNLFGSPATSLPMGFSPVLDSNLFRSPAVQQQARTGGGLSKALAHIAKLQKEHTQLVQQLKVHVFVTMSGRRIL